MARRADHMEDGHTLTYVAHTGEQTCQFGCIGRHSTTEEPQLWGTLLCENTETVLLGRSPISLATTQYCCWELMAEQLLVKIRCKRIMHLRKYVFIRSLNATHENVNMRFCIALSPSCHVSHQCDFCLLPCFGLILWRHILSYCCHIFLKILLNECI
jgi:hypothetical protein